MSLVVYLTPGIIFFLFAWGTMSYGAYLVQETYNFLFKLLAASIFNMLLLLSMSSYLKCFFAQHKDMPEEFRLPSEISLRSEDRSDNMRDLISNLVRARKLPILTYGTFSKDIKFCNICRVVKPDRAHHCSHCNKCILKMDHHCIWVGNCIGYINYKAFVLFLLYTTFLSIFYFGTVLQFLLRTWKDEKQYNLAIFLWIICISFIPLSVLLGMHLYFVSCNRTTMESFMTPSFILNELNDNKYNLGFTQNFYQVFGNDFLSMLSPWTKNHGDGVIFPILYKDQIYQDMSEHIKIEPRISVHGDSIGTIEKRKSNYDAEKGTQE